MPTLSLRGIFRFDGRGLQKGLKDARRQTERFTSDIKGMIAGAFTAGALSSGIRDALTFADRVDLLASKFRTSREEVQKLDFALKPFGKDINFLNQALGTLGQSSLEALRNPAGGKADLFAAFGIDKQSLERDSPLELLLKIGDTLSKLDFGGKETPLLGNLIGSEAADLVPILQRDLRGLTEEAKEFGAIMSDEMVDELSAANKQVAAFGSSSRVVFGQIASFLIDAATKITNALNVSVGGLGSFIGAFMGTDGNFFQRLEAGSTAFEQHMTGITDRRIAKEKAAQEAAASAQNKREQSGIDVDRLLQAEQLNRKREQQGRELEKINEELTKIQFERLTAEEKENALLLEREEIMKRLRAAEDQATSNRKAKENRITEIDALRSGGQTNEEAKQLSQALQKVQSDLATATAQKDQERIAAAKAAMQDLFAEDRKQRSRVKISQEESIALLEERKQLVDELGQKEADTIDAARAKLDLEKNRNALEKLTGDGSSRQSNTDSLAKIGGFVGGAASRAQNNQEQILRTVKGIAENVAAGVDVKGA